MQAIVICATFTIMLETKTDQQRPDLDRLIDSFVDIIRSMLSNSKTPYLLHKEMLKSFELPGAEEAIGSVRRLLRMTDSTFHAHWDFLEEFRKTDLTADEKALFQTRIHNILIEQQEPLTEHSYQYWEKLKPGDQDELYQGLIAEHGDILRVAIDGEWELFDLTSFSHKISSGYEIFLELYLLQHYQVVYGNRQFTALFGDDFHPSDFGNMRIVQMKYASPGHFDLLGIGKVIEQFVLLINKIVHWKREHKLAKLENTKKQLDLLKEMKIDLDELGLDSHTREKLQLRLSGAAQELFNWLEPEQITGAEHRLSGQDRDSHPQELN
ncbi:hypothetical protein DBR40_07490 [Pedobacter sp. KBW01]|nr:hypothetical protein DBR40_07490 [Pedobacter sp. KBW01]